MAGKDQVKQKIDIVDYIGAHVPLKPSGRNFKGLCPFHKEKSPSFFVSPERQSYHCFGCGESGDIFTFYQKTEGVDFFQSLKDLADHAGITLTDFKPDQSYQQKQTLIEIHILAAKYFHYLLTSHSAGQLGLNYLKNRGVPPSQISHFQIGFIPNSWHSLTNYLLAKKFDPQLLEQSGLSLRSPKTNQLYDRFRGRIMFPLHDARGHIVGFSGRILPQFDDGKSGKYINSPETPIYHKSQMLFPIYHTKEHIRKAGKVIVVEGELDALASYKAGIKHVVAVKGTAFTLDQVKVLSRYTDTIILALDADSAGISAAKRSINIIKDFDLNVRVLQIKQGKDPDEIVKADPAKWRQLVKDTDDIYDFFISSALKQFNSADPYGQKQITQELLPLFSQIQNQVVQNHFIKKLASKLGVKPEIIESEMNRIAKKSQLTPAKPLSSNSPAKPESDSSDQALSELLTLVINHYSKLDLAKLPLSDFPPSSITQILKRFIQNQFQNLNQFADSLPSHLKKPFDIAFLAEIPTLDNKKLHHHYQFLISRIAKNSLRDKLSEIRKQLKTTSDPDQLKQLKHQLKHAMVRFSSYQKQN